METTERAIWLALAETKGVGAKTFWKLIDVFGSAQVVWEASESELSQVVSKRVVEQLVTRQKEIDPEQLWQRYIDHQITIVTSADEAYPQNLLALPNRPPVLYVKGELVPDDARALGVVGTRLPTAYGVQVTKQLVSELASNGLTTVSGLALGVDAIAHQAALEAGGRTLAVQANGLDQIYPRSHQQLAERIMQSGAIVSTFPLGEQPLRGNFVARNEWVAGLSLGILVTEGASKSGTRITAEYAMKQGKPVFAVPGPITSSMSVAPSELIKTGATLVTSAEDILGNLGLGKGTKSTRGITSINKPELTDPTQKKIWQLLIREPLEQDDLVRQIGLSAGEISVALTMMELEGLVQKLGNEWVVS